MVVERDAGVVEEEECVFILGIIPALAPFTRSKPEPDWNAD